MKNRYWAQVCSAHSRWQNWQTVSRHDELQMAIEAATREVNDFQRVARVIDGESGQVLWRHGTMRQARRGR